MTERIPNLIADGRPVAEREVVEVPLLLPSWQVTALATAAQDRGLTAAQMLRHLLHDFIEGLEDRQTATTR